MPQRKTGLFATPETFFYLLFRNCYFFKETGFLYFHLQKMKGVLVEKSNRITADLFVISSSHSPFFPGVVQFFKFFKIISRKPFV